VPTEPDVRSAPVSGQTSTALIGMQRGKKIFSPAQCRVSSYFLGLFSLR